MPDRGDERGRGGTRTLVTGILADTEWHPATNPQEAAQTARAARDLAVRLRPVLSKLAQAPRGGRRRDLEWLPAVEQLAVDAQYFASWWLPRLEGKSAQSWPSWSADGYADWVKRLDAQRQRTLEMVQGTTPVTRIASVTQLRRGKSEPDAENAAERETGAGARDLAATSADEGPSASADSAEKERSARVTPLRGPGAALMDAALLDVSGSPDARAEGTKATEGEHIEAERIKAERIEAEHIEPPAVDPSKAVVAKTDSDDRAASLAASTAGSEIAARASTNQALPPVPRTPPNQGPVEGGKATTPTRPSAVPSAPHGYGDLNADGPDLTAGGPDLTADGPSLTAEAPRPRVPHTPPNRGPADADARVGADILQIPQIPRTPPNSGPPEADPNPAKPPAPVVSLIGEKGPRVPRTPPNPGPAGNGVAAGADAETKHIALAPAGPAAVGAGSKPRGVEAGAQSQGNQGPKALESGSGEQARPLFRSGASAPAAAVLTGAAAGTATGAAVAGAGTNSVGTDTGPSAKPGAGVVPGTGPGPGAGPGSGSGPGSRSGPASIAAGHAVGVGMYGSGSPSQHDEFENFQPGTDLPPPVFPMTEPTEPVDRARIVRFALAAVVLAAAGVAVFVVATQKGSAAKAATAPPATSSASASPTPSATDSSSSSIAGAVTAPTSTDAAPVSSSAAKPAPPPPKPSTPPSTSTAPQTSAPPQTASAVPPSVPRQSPASGGIRSLSVTSLAPDATGGFTYVAHVHVTANGTGVVTVTVTFAGTSSSSSPGPNGQPQTFRLSGKTSYDFDAQMDVHGLCQPSQPYIDAVASASGAGSSVAYATSPC